MSMNNIRSENLIYNRFDLIHEKCRIKTYIFECNGQNYEIQIYVHGLIADANVWGKDIPESAIENLKDKIEEENPQVGAIYIQRVTHNYFKTLMKGFEQILSLPETEQELLERLNKKESHNIRRKMRFRGQGSVSLIFYQNDKIPDDLVSTFFVWKNNSHGTDYQMTPQEYLDRYHVTDAIEMRLENTLDDESKTVAVLFWCGVEETVYFENISYDKDFEKFSPGFLIYIEFLKELVIRGYRTVFLGGADYGYKKKFNSIARECYTGYVFTQAGLNLLDQWMDDNGIIKWGIYGGGNLGKAVFSLSKRIRRQASFIIDNNLECISGVKVYKPDEIWPSCDLVIVAIFGDTSKIKEMMNIRNQECVQYFDLIERLYGT